MKGVLINVGANSKRENLGRSGPKFEDGTYRYVPIPEFYTYPECPTYTSLGLSEFVPTKHRMTQVHVDPELDSWTYGDYPEKRPKAALHLLKPNDWLFFLASLDLHTKSIQGRWIRDEKRFYIIGYFELEEPIFNTSSLTRAQQSRFAQNAHEKRPIQDGHALFGGTAKSRRFPLAFPFTREIAEKVLRSPSDPRGPLRWIYYVNGRKQTETARINSYTRTASLLTAEQVRFLLEKTRPYL